MAIVRTLTRRLWHRLRAVPRSHAHGAAAAPLLALALLDVVPLRVGLVLAVSLAIAAVGHLAVELRARASRRREADRLLVAIDADRIPDPLRWRAAELTRARERRALARALRNLLRSLELPPFVLPTPVNRAALRRNHRAVEALAARLAALDQPVRVRGVLLIRQLLAGSSLSPLYDRAAAGELRGTLARVRSEIEPR